MGTLITTREKETDETVEIEESYLTEYGIFLLLFHSSSSCASLNLIKIFTLGCLLSILFVVRRPTYYIPSLTIYCYILTINHHHYIILYYARNEEGYMPILALLNIVALSSSVSSANGPCPCPCVCPASPTPPTAKP